MTTTVSESTTGNAKPARCSSVPMSRTSANGATRGEAPPLISASATIQASRSSFSVDPPSSEASSSPSGFSARRICTNAPGRSLTSWSERPETTRSSEASAKGSASSSATTRKPEAPRSRSAVVSTSMMRSTPASPRIPRETRPWCAPMFAAKGKLAGRWPVAPRGRRRRAPGENRGLPQRRRRAPAAAPAAHDRRCERGLVWSQAVVLAAALICALP